MDKTVHITCPHCNAINRIPERRFAEGPNCGRCHQNLFNGHPLTLTDANATSVLENNDLPVVVDFWASWCGPCRQFAPTFENIAKAFELKSRFAKLDTDANPNTASKFQIRSIPTLIVTHHGKESARQSGALPYAQFKQWLEQTLNLYGN